MTIQTRLRDYGKRRFPIRQRSGGLVNFGKRLLVDLWTKDGQHPL